VSLRLKVVVSIFRLGTTKKDAGSAEQFEKIDRE